MKMQDAMKIINKSDGFMVHFEKIEGSVLCSDYFPEKNSGEKLIETEYLAWQLAEKFANKTDSIIVNIYVVDSNFIPVEGYNSKILKKH